MAFEKLNGLYYLADTKEDLKEILKYNSKMGLECYVIKEACEYKLMSTGEWIKQSQSAAVVPEGGNVDLSGYATESYVDDKIAEIEVPSVEGLASEEFVSNKIAEIKVPSIEGLATEKFVKDEVAKIEIPSIEGLASEEFVNEALELIKSVPVMKMFAEDADIMASNPGSQFGIALNKGDNRTLPEAMLEKGVGLYNFWIHKSNASLPAEAFAKNSSCRGLCCVDTVKSTGWYGWILLVDQDGDAYIQYIRNAEPQGWKNLTISSNESSVSTVVEQLDKKIKSCYRPIKYEITHTPKGTIIDYDRCKEIRVFCPEYVTFTKQNVGATGNSNMYYMAFKAYAPEGAKYFKEGDRGVIVDELHTFKEDFSGTDEFGRNYSICWLALASFNESTGEWTYFGKSSTDEKYIGWTYIVEWYDENQFLIDKDMLRINLSNEECHFESNNALWNDL